MECYKDGLSHIGTFDGNESTKVEQFLAQIERIGNLIEAQPNVLYSMTKAKLVGEAANWFTANQATLTEWEELKAQMLTRFKPVTSSSQLFEKLTKRRQGPDESIITYYDSVIKLCREYDPSMSDKMKISCLEKGLKDELKIQVKRQMKALTEQIPHAFLQIAKAEAELLSQVQLPSEITQSYFIPSTISTITRPAFGGQSPRPHLFRSREPRYYSNQTTQRVPQSPFNRSQGLLRNKYAQLQPRPISSTTNSQSQQQTPALAKPEQIVRNATQEVFQTSMENRNAQQLALRGQQSKVRIQCRPCLSTGFRITGVQDGGTPSKQRPSVSSTLASPTSTSPVGLFTASALLNVKKHATKVLIINANNRQFTLSKHTKLGTIAFQTEPTICYTIASKPVKGNVRFRTDKSREFQSKIPIHQCYVCQKNFLSRNDLHVHLRHQCCPTEIREHIDTMTKHIENEDQREQLQVINYTLEGAINTGDHAPIHIPPYRQSGKDQQRIQDGTDKLLKQGIIEPSTSPWSSPVVLLAESAYFTKVDFKSGYFQIPLHPNDRPKTAFSTRDNHYQFTVLPQGFTNGPPSFQRIINQALGPARWKYALAYIDDIIIYSKTFDDHLVHLEQMFGSLNQQNFRLNVGKSEIAKREIGFLGHQVKEGNIKPNPENIRALMETQIPTTEEEACRFLKGAEYYRKFIRGFSSIADPLYKYVPKKKQGRSKQTSVTLSENVNDGD
ncbi:unnamed protein product [Didymodactylos carnosus]|uniref:Reverse transcriptase domain-containing protein n=1 Tax=Didymodactylos carnosus TaxID=1234261 RepID=A0A814V9C5_9BILA|nr:unnamed protein product [Didymodactylos carnosus]CAF3948132.1 unnamed protein product [Didymodactylos carnosus]